MDTRTHDSTHDDRRLRAATDDRVRWGPIWAGLVVSVASFVLLQLTLFATDLIDLDVAPGDAEVSIGFWTAAAAVVAFLLGGLVAGATAKWRRLDDGLMNGIILWGLSTVVLVGLASVAARGLTSSLGGTLGRLADIRDTLTDGGSLSAGQEDDARDAAASAVLFLGLTIGAVVLGSLIGSKLWPRRGHLDDEVALAPMAGRVALDDDPTAADERPYRRTDRDDYVPPPPRDDDWHRTGELRPPDPHDTGSPRR